MSNNDLQRVTKSVSYIGQAISRRSLPTRRNRITQKVKIAAQRTLYLSVHDDEQPAEIFLRLKGSDCSSELIGLYDVIARLMSLPDLIGRHLLVEYCGREELAHTGTPHHV